MPHLNKSLVRIGDTKSLDMNPQADGGVEFVFKDGPIPLAAIALDRERVAYVIAVLCKLSGITVTDTRARVKGLINVTQDAVQPEGKK